MEQRIKHVKNYAKIVIFLFAGIFGCFWFYEKMVVSSALHWTFMQEAYANGVLEIFFFFLTLAIVLVLPKKKWVKFTAVFLVLSVFSYLHSFLYPFVAGVLYGCMILMTGALLCRIFAPKWQNDFSAYALMGIVGILLMVCFCSALQIGTAEKLRVFFLPVFVFEIIFLRKEIHVKIRALFSEEAEVYSLKNTVFWTMIAGAIAAFLVQLGRANIALDYDSVWYGLRSDTILAPTGGIYDSVIMPGIVYSYPKGIEALSLAFNFQNSYSFVYAVNLMLAAVVLGVVYQIVKSFSNRNGAAFAMLCCAATAGIMNMASTAKSDIAAFLTQAIMLWFSFSAVKNKDGSALFLAMAAAILSFSFKLSSLIFSVILLVVLVFFAIIIRIKIRFKEAVPLLISILATGLIWLRTYILTGVPANFLNNLWTSLGFEFNYPYYYTSMGRGSLSELLTTSLFWERLGRLSDFLFNPISSEMDHVIIAWGGLLFAVVWIWIVLRIFLHPVRTWNRICQDTLYAFSLISLAVISAASMGCVMLLTKPDGNYFMLMYAMTFVHAIFELQQLEKLTSSWYKIALIPLVCCGVIMCTASHWSWQVGLTPINLENKGYYDHLAEKEWKYEYIQMDQIVDYLEQEKTLPRVIMVANDVPHLLDIPAISESFLDIAHWGDISLVQSAESFYNYCQTIDLDYILVENTYLENWDLAASALGFLEDAGYLEMVMQQGDFSLLRFIPNY